MHQHDREIRTVGRIDLGEPHDALARHGAALDQPGVVEPPCGSERAAHLLEIAAGLHDDRAHRDVAHAPFELVLGERAHQHRRDVVAKRDRLSDPIPATDHAGNACDHLDLDARLAGACADA